MTRVWVWAIALSILAGEMSAVSLGGQNGRLLWTDLVLAGGVGVGVLIGGGRVHVPRAPLLTGLLPFLALTAVGLMFAGDLLTGIAEIKEWVFALIAGAASVLASKDERGAIWTLKAVATTAAGIAIWMIVAALQSPLGPVLAVLTKTVDLPWGRSNYLAGLLAVGLPLAVALVVRSRRAMPRLGWSLTAALIGTGLVLSASKGALLACVIGFSLALVGAGQAARPWQRFGLVLLALAILAYAVTPLREASAYRLLPSALDFSTGERMRLYEVAIEQFLRHPLIGIGLNNFSVAAHHLHGVDTVPHNFALGFLAETGIVGTVIVTMWGMSVAAAMAAPSRAARDSRDPDWQAFALGPWVVFLIAVVHNQFESTLYGEQFKVMLMLVAGAAWGLARSTSLRTLAKATP